MLSVVTITYNNAEGLVETLQSVAEQSIECEHIVVDGASSDATMVVLSNHTGPNFFCISEPDRGRYHAMNKGIANSTGDVIWLMHSGDRFASTTSAETGYRALKHSAFRWAYGLSRVSRDGQIVEVRGAVPFRRLKFLIGRETIPHQAVLMEKTLIAELDGYDEKVGLAEDQNFLMRAVARHEPLVIAEILCDFDGHGAGSVRSPWTHYKDLWKARRRNQMLLGSSGLLDVVVTSLYWARAAVAQKYFGRP